MSELNFLCVHKNYRSKNLAAKLIAEVTRRVNLKNKWQAVFIYIILDLYIRYCFTDPFHPSSILSSIIESQETD